ncbi:hypothetical protein GALMADRAFT_1297669 [Galerina marginata CBS 339.88]|uniref:Uncharacterized protein n=1 Tax=Galerina marginata (strain CBS 339.88) TaxID=685588 RepID=A0A067TGD5_GALM3|nr:hypothetical protein GALMADRAFT_1297669 [Galerina marginata CBS 339.88]
MSAVIRTPDPKPSLEKLEMVDFDRYKDFVREVLQVSSPAMIEFRRRTPLPVCVICSKRPEGCKIELAIDTYRCAVCSRRRKTCSWKAEILVLETVRRFGVTEVQAEELYNKWGRGIRVDQGLNEPQAVDPKPSGESESSDITSTPNTLRIKLYPKLTIKGHESQNQSKKRNNPESTSSRKSSNKRPRLLSDGDAGNADAIGSETEFDAIKSAPAVTQPTTPRTSTPSTPPQFVSRLSVTHLCTPNHLPLAPPAATTLPSELALPPTSSQMDGEHQQIRQ